MTPWRVSTSFFRGRRKSFNFLLTPRHCGCISTSTFAFLPRKIGPDGTTFLAASDPYPRACISNLALYEAAPLRVLRTGVRTEVLRPSFLRRLLNRSPATPSEGALTFQRAAIIQLCLSGVPQPESQCRPIFRGDQVFTPDLPEGVRLIRSHGDPFFVRRLSIFRCSTPDGSPCRFPFKVMRHRLCLTGAASAREPVRDQSLWERLSIFRCSTPVAVSSWFPFWSYFSCAPTGALAEAMGPIFREDQVLTPDLHEGVWLNQRPFLCGAVDHPKMSNTCCCFQLVSRLVIQQLCPTGAPSKLWGPIFVGAVDLVLPSPTPVAVSSRFPF
jgi:hypothetical protein